MRRQDYARYHRPTCVPLQCQSCAPAPSSSRLRSCLSISTARAPSRCGVRDVLRPRRILDRTLAFRPGRPGIFTPAAPVSAPRRELARTRRHPRPRTDAAGGAASRSSDVSPLSWTPRLPARFRGRAVAAPIRFRKRAGEQMEPACVKHHRIHALFFLSVGVDS
ncbi:hypothetical protein C8J57DRAFT_147500 [Mycena rebaudengoi]|nr:hypothetical protein C8J57DRAFT_147500 [Mycena rebaudengoi]